MSIDQILSGAEPETSLRDFMRYEPVADRLFPLHHWRTLGKDGKSLGKTPLEPGWRTKVYPFDDMRKRIESGANVGIRLGSGLCVLDWDMRHDPAHQDPANNSLARLCRDHALELRDDAIVVTGNGLHIYATMPADALRLLNDIDQYNGVEFKADGRYAVCGGSRHPSGHLYKWKGWTC